MTGYFQITESIKDALTAELFKDLQRKIKILTVMCNVRLKLMKRKDIIIKQQQLRINVLHDDIAEYIDHCAALHDALVAEETKQRWHLYGLAFAAGVVAMAAFASWYVSL